MRHSTIVFKVSVTVAMFEWRFSLLLWAHAASLESFNEPNKDVMGGVWTNPSFCSLWASKAVHALPGFLLVYFPCSWFPAPPSIIGQRLSLSMIFPLLSSRWRKETLLYPYRVSLSSIFPPKPPNAPISASPNLTTLIFNRLSLPPAVLGSWTLLQDWHQSCWWYTGKSKLFHRIPIMASGPRLALGPLIWLAGKLTSWRSDHNRYLLITSRGMVTVISRVIFYVTNLHQGYILSAFEIMWCKHINPLKMQRFWS